MKSLKNHEQGVRGVDMVRQYVRSMSTICTILKQKESIKGCKTCQGHHNHLMTPDHFYEETERMLLVGLSYRELAGDTVIEDIIFEKVRTIYNDQV